MMTEPLKTVHVGLGPIGLEILKAGARTGACEPVSCADISPEIAGRSLRVVAEEEDLPNVTICAELHEAIQQGVEAEAAVAVVCTGSRVEQIEAQLEAPLAGGLHCISTCEELVFPWLRAATVADRLDATAAENDVVLLGAGVNPGFVLDLLPFILTRVCQSVEAVQAGRFVDASRRRRQLQAKIGSGMSPDQFRAEAAEGRIGHVGLAESAALLADCLGWQWEEFEEVIDPVVADEPIATDYFHVEAGQVCGQAQAVTMGDVRLQLTMSLGSEDRDEVRIEGRPPVHAVIRGGIHGDTATAGTVMNLLRPLTRAEPGLRTVTEIPLA
ncbi:MAG: dihydrodipicolinate reductase [Armatimonadota bacterium]